MEAHEELRIPNLSKSQLKALGYRPSFGAPKGQLADFRKALDDGRGLHVRDYGSHMTVHWDRTAPSVNLVGHLIDDAPGWALAGGVAAAIALSSGG